MLLLSVSPKVWHRCDIFSHGVDNSCRFLLLLLPVLVSFSLGLLLTPSKGSSSCIGPAPSPLAMGQVDQGCPRHSVAPRAGGPDLKSTRELRVKDDLNKNLALVTAVVLDNDRVWSIFLALFFSHHKNTTLARTQFSSQHFYCVPQGKAVNKRALWLFSFLVLA